MSKTVYLNNCTSANNIINIIIPTTNKSVYIKMELDIERIICDDSKDKNKIIYDSLYIDTTSILNHAIDFLGLENLYLGIYKATFAN